MTRERELLRGEISAQLRLAGPVVLVQVGLVAMGVVDGAFMGRVSAIEYAAVALGHSFSFVFLGFGMGTLACLDPIVSQAFGAREHEAIARALQRGILLALLLALGVAAVLAFTGPILMALGQPPEVIPIARDYVWVSIAGVPAFLLFVAQRQALQATHRLRPLVLVILLANGLNALLDWVLIGGHFGAPALGAVGCAWGTVIARWVLALSLPFFAGRELWERLWPVRPGVTDLVVLARMLRVGVPVGFQYALEIGAFACVLFFMGQLGEVELAAHQVTMSLASTSFMVPLGISMAASVRVGNEIGRGDPAAMRRACHVALAGAVLTMALTGALFLLAPGPLARLLTNLDPVLATAATLIPIAGLFQVCDGLQGVAVGCLRGMADTRIPLFVHVLGFWGVAIPVSAFLGLSMKLGARGLWWGLAVGLLVTAIVQLMRLRLRLQSGVERLLVEHEAP